MSGSARLVSSSEVARALGVTRQTVARWVRQEIITPASVTAGGQARFNLEAVKQQLREHGRRQRERD
ncbi:helix-turn-helix domain-containing protein [Saccharopolyspora spinosa]|uniref:helix-turn-helix domain-containing protein n=1 Tax=Saccharopolyspora spinosa TaxID=60894 RepID=UPI0009FF4601|nr:helix-turn-helix domain-containing protein [Saccharopolyspora spinosa]